MRVITFAILWLGSNFVTANLVIAAIMAVQEKGYYGWYVAAAGVATLITGFASIIIECFRD